jgi:hypothetical protein
MPRKPASPASSTDRPSRRTERIEILCFPGEKAAIERRAGRVPVGRWARIQLQGKRPNAADAVPVARVLGFAETIERLALDGNVDAILSTARAIQHHLRARKS